MSNNISKNKVFTNIIWKYAESMGAKIVTFIVSIILARILEPGVYGVIALAMVVISILSVFVDSGFGNALIQKKDADEVDFSTVFFFNIMISIILYLFVFALAPYIAYFYNLEELKLIIRILAITILVSGVKNIQQAYVAKHMIFKKFFFSTLGGTIGAAVVGIYMAYAGFGVWALVVQVIFNQTVDTIILWITVEWRPRLVFSFERLRGLVAYGGKLLVASLLETISVQIRSFIIGKKYTTESLAYYNKGDSWPNLIVMSVVSAIDGVLFPAMSYAQDNTEVLKSMTRKAIKVGSYVLMPIMIGLAVCAKPLVCVVLTEKWLPVVPFLRIFCVTYAFYPIHSANLNVLKALGKSDVYLKIELVKKIISILSIIISMWYGVWAIACSMFVISWIFLFINISPNSLFINYGIIEQFRDIIPEIALSVFMGFLVHMIGMIDFNIIVGLIVQICVGIGVYLIGSICFRLESYYYLVGIFFNDSRRNEG